MTAPSPQREPEDTGVFNAEVEFAAAERLSFFSDAVLAIAITLLALGLPLPAGSTNGQVWDSLTAHYDEYLAFFVSFVVVGSNWTSHHAVFRYISRLGGRFRQWNMLWLLMMVITPFVTRVLTAGNGGFAARFTLYAVVQVIASFCFLQMLSQMTRHHLLRDGTPAAIVTHSRWRRIALLTGFVVSIPVSFVSHLGAFACWIALPTLTRFLRRARPGWIPAGLQRWVLEHLGDEGGDR